MLAGCGGRKQAEVRIAIGGQAQLIYLPATLAQELGYYKDAGLNVTLLDFPGGAKALEALMGGSTDVVCGFYDHTIQMAAQGKELWAFVAMLRYPGLVLVSPNAGRIEDLKGKTVGVSAPGSSTHMFLNYLLVAHGMKADDVSNASIGMSATAVGAVTHNKVDAAVMTDPALAIVRKQMLGIAHSGRHEDSRGSAGGIRRRELSVGGALFEGRVGGEESRDREATGECDHEDAFVDAVAHAGRDSREDAGVISHGGCANRR